MTAHADVVIDITGYFLEGVVTNVNAGVGLSGGGSGNVTIGINTQGSTAGQVLTSTGSGVQWQNVPAPPPPPPPAAIAGAWSQTTPRTGNGFYEWDTERINTAPTVFQRVSGNAAIQVGAAGLYMITVHVAVSGHCNGAASDTYLKVGAPGSMVSIDHNFQIIIDDVHWRHHLSGLAALNAGDLIQVEMINHFSTDCYDRDGDSSPNSGLIIVKLQ